MGQLARVAAGCPRRPHARPRRRGAHVPAAAASRRARRARCEPRRPRERRPSRSTAPGIRCEPRCDSAPPQDGHRPVYAYNVAASSHAEPGNAPGFDHIVLVTDAARGQRTAQLAAELAGQRGPQRARHHPAPRGPACCAVATVLTRSASCSPTCRSTRSSSACTSGRRPSRPAATTPRCCRSSSRRAPEYLALFDALLGQFAPAARRACRRGHRDGARGQAPAAGAGLAGPGRHSGRHPHAPVGSVLAGISSCRTTRSRSCAAAVSTRSPSTTSPPGTIRATCSSSTGGRARARSPRS